MPDGAQILLVGVSGPSSSGKTTLARLLRAMCPRSFIVHEDDFYFPDSRIPVKNGIQDWDCIEAIDTQALHSALVHVKRTGHLPPGFHSKEDQNSVGSVNVDQSTIDACTDEIRKALVGNGSPTVVFVDGFLLYAEHMTAIRDLFDVKLFLRTDHDTTKSRREARSGYVTLDGFWQDPPGYVDDIVWPNYVHDHAFLFQNGDVNGAYDTDACLKAGISTSPQGSERDMTSCVRWAAEILAKAPATTSQSS